MTEESGFAAGIKGVTEEVKGKAKEAAGAVTGNEDLEREGKAQQDRADAEREVAAREAQAEKARAKAESAERRQETHQNS